MEQKDEVASVREKERGESDMHRRSAFRSMVPVVPEAQLLQTHSGHNYSERCPLQWISLISDEHLSVATHSTSLYRVSELHEVCKLCEMCE